MREKTERTFIVQVPMPNNNRFKFDLKPYLAKVISYKKGADCFIAKPFSITIGPRHPFRQP